MDPRPSLVARLLASAWQKNPKPLDISHDELNKIEPLLLGSGAGSLGWNRIRNSDLRSTESGNKLQQAYRKHTLEAALHESQIKQSYALLRGIGIEPILLKGWSIARQYPEKGLRPYDDIDLAVPEEQFLAARSAILEIEELSGYVDLHRGRSSIDPLDYGRDWLAQTELVTLGDTNVRILMAEENLRTICIHLLRHGAFRPLWLCDIAVATESRKPDFDWARCFGDNKRIADWIACTIGLAHELLGARIDDTPVRGRAEKLPVWLPKAVLRQWEKPFASHHGVAKHRAPMANYLRNPSGLLSDIRSRWPDPIEATVFMRGPFNALPRWPFQAGECLGRTIRFLTRFPKRARDA